MDNEQLIEYIENAFSNVKYPGDMNIINSMQYYESQEMWQIFKGKDWKDIGIRIAGDWRMKLSTFTDAGFQYFLPAFLIASIGEDPFEVSMFVEFSLIPPDEDNDRMERFIQRTNLFDNLQRGAIHKYLQYLASYADDDIHDDMKRLLSFWQPNVDDDLASPSGG